MCLSPQKIYFIDKTYINVLPPPSITLIKNISKTPGLEIKEIQFYIHKQKNILTSKLMYHLYLCI